MKTHILIICVVLTSVIQAFASEQTDYEWPLGPIGGKFRIISGENFIRVVSVTANAPGAQAGLQESDFIFGAFGEEFTSIGSDFQGAVTELGDAIDKAEGADGQLPLMVLRPGAGNITITVDLPVLGRFGPAYPLNSTKFQGMYETACAELHQRALASNGNLGHPTGWAGFALLGHPNWDQTSGARPFRNSIDAIKDYYAGVVNNSVYAPVESKMPDGVTDNPNYVSVGLENWQLGQAVMFLAEYYSKTGDPTVAAVVQRGAEVCANRIQWWSQPTTTSYNVGYDTHRGVTGHGGVSGDYTHSGWFVGINMTGLHLFNGLAFAKRAGADMTVRPKDGHYWGLETAPAGVVPAGMENYDHTLDEKFEMKWGYLMRSSSSSGRVNYAINTGAAYDAGGRTPASLLGYLTYHNNNPPNQDDADRVALQKDYIIDAHFRHQHAHAYNLGGTIFQQMAMPYLDSRRRQFFYENWKFFYTLSREPNGSLTNFRGRNVGDAYQDYSLVALINAALPTSIASGGLTLIPGHQNNGLLADFRSPSAKWTDLANRSIKTAAPELNLQIDITNGTGTILDPSEYTANWEILEGPATPTFSASNQSSTTVTFPSSGSYKIQLTASKDGDTLTEPIQVDAFLTAVPEGWTRGRVNYDVYTGIDGGAITDLTSSAKYPDSPDSSTQLSSLEGTQSGSDYGAVLAGVIIPPTTGDYTFYIAGDDEAELWFNSAGSTEAGATLIAEAPAWTSEYEWDKYTQQKSATISLTAGELYYFRALHKEDGGGDHVAIAWERPGITDPEVIGSAYIASPPRQSLAPAILTQPVSVSTTLGGNASFTITTEGPDPSTYQWRLNGDPIGNPSADPTLSLLNVGGGLVGTYDCVFTAGDQVLISDSATLTLSDVGQITAGGLWREVYNGIDGSAVEDLTNSEKFPLFSDSSEVITVMETPNESVTNDFGARWSGWIIPDETADYRFLITGDDQVELWLSPTQFEGHKEKIAHLKSTVTARAWTSAASSEYISLVANQRYYIEVLHKENGGAEHAAIAWQKQGDPDLADGADPIQAAHLEYQVGGVYRDDNEVAPIAQDDQMGVATGQAAVFDVLNNDLDDRNDILQITTVTQGTYGSVSFSGRNVTYTPNGGHPGADSFTYSIENRFGLVATATVEVLVFDPNANMQGWWRLEEGSGIVAKDLSGVNRHGQVQGNPTWLPGAMSFDGSDDKIVVGELNSILGQTASLSFRIRTTQAGQAQGSSSSQAVAGYDARWWEHDIKWGVLDSVGRIGIWLEDENDWVGSTTVVNDGQWRNVVLTRDVATGELQVFIDGVLENTSIGRTGSVNYTMTAIGRLDSNDGSGSWFNGDLDEIRLYDRVLSAPEVAAIHNYTPSDQPPTAQTAELNVTKPSGGVFDLTKNIVDEVTPALEISAITSGPANGTLQLLDNHRVLYIPNNGFVGGDSFTYQVTDSEGNVISVNANVTVHDLSNEFVGYYAFEDDLNDTSNSANVNNGSVGGGSPTFIEGKFSRGLSLDGVDDFVTLGTPADYAFGTNTSFTLSFWYRTSDDQTDEPVIIGNKDWNSGYNPGWLIEADSGNGDDFGLQIGDGSNRADSPSRDMTFNKWHHVVAVFERGQNMDLYVDGAKSSSTDISNVTGSLNALALNIGQDGTGTYTDFTLMDIDDLGIWRRALSAEEIAIVIAAGEQEEKLNSLTSSGFLDWQKTIAWNSNDYGEDGNPDHDNLTNLEEYALNRDPLSGVGDAFDSVKINRSEGDAQIELKFRKNALALDVEVFVEMSTDQVSWQRYNPAPANLTEVVDGNEVSVTMLKPPTQEREFFRLKVIRRN